ncbi:MAG: hypothetical protein JXB00_16320 [Bacteroidales bacterium]|nr:hypothetical protein [Bacteroidales bacterium]
MNKYFLHSIILIVLVIILVNCSEDTDHVKTLKYSSTILGGCNGQDFGDLKSTSEDFADTVIFTIKNDTLDVFVGLNYICCAPFTSEAATKGDSILITISDACKAPYLNCYCKCMCYYTWDFTFVDFEEKEYPFKIILNDPHEENPVIIKEGSLQIYRWN